MRLPISLAFLAIAACGGNNGDDTDPDDTDPAGDCAYAGTANGCLIYESTDCTTDTSYDGAAGGWYELAEDGSMFVQLAPNDAGLQLGFEILDASAIGPNVEYSLPTQVILHFTDAAGTEYQACNGKLTITAYTPGDTLWGKWSFMAKSITGVCEQVDYYSSGGEFINVEPCG